ncbi:MAG: DsbA family protein [Bryobacterales bacterium]|nr:DsbA family protein [Bryobacterales bacterium]
MNTLRTLGLGALSAALVWAQSSAPNPLSPATPGVKTAAVKKSALDKKVMEEWVRHLFLWPPQVTVTVGDYTPADIAGMLEVTVTGTAGGASVRESFLVTQDGQKILRGSTFDINKSPFQKELELTRNDMQPSIGTPGAPVVITLFSDFQCQFCRDEAKALRENLIKTYPNQVRLYFRDFPLEQIHAWARPAAIAGRCIFKTKPAAFWDFHDWIFDKQPEITPENLKTKVMEFVQSKGLDAVKTGACIDSKATEADVNKSIAEGRLLKVESTPTLFVNGRKIAGNIPWQNLKMVIDWDLDYSKRTGLTAEKCCEVTLPSPLNQK